MSDTARLCIQDDNINGDNVGLTNVTIPDEETHAPVSSGISTQGPAPYQQSEPIAAPPPVDTPRVALVGGRVQSRPSRCVIVKKTVQTNRGPLVITRIVQLPDQQQGVQPRQPGPHPPSTTISPGTGPTPRRKSSKRCIIASGIVGIAVIVIIAVVFVATNKSEPSDSSWNNGGYGGNNGDNGGSNGETGGDNGGDNGDNGGDNDGTSSTRRGYIASMDFNIDTQGIVADLENVNSPLYKQIASQTEGWMDELLLQQPSTYKTYDLNKLHDIDVQTGYYTPSQLKFHIFMKNSDVSSSSIKYLIGAGIRGSDNHVISLIGSYSVSVVYDRSIPYPRKAVIPSMPTYQSQGCDSNFTCKSGRCIPSTSLCNGHSECFDTSDEDWRQCHECQPITIDACKNILPYSTAYFPNKAVSTQAMAADWLTNLDDYLHCNEHAAMFACLLYAPSCPDGQGVVQRPCRSFCYSVLYSCLSVLREVLHIFPSFSCTDLDNNDGCWAPVTTCNVMEFKCNSGQCVHVLKRCDGTGDCYDGSDEHQCTYGNGECSDLQYSCTDGGKCIPLGWKCDDLNDCGDGSDEDGYCPSSSRSCSYFSEFTCANGVCITNGNKCNAIDDCGDYSDESVDECGQMACGQDFSCTSIRQCIPAHQECDGSIDCHDRSDETNCLLQPLSGYWSRAKLDGVWRPICANNWNELYSNIVCEQLGYRILLSYNEYVNTDAHISAVVQTSVSPVHVSYIHQVLESTTTCPNDKFISITCSGLSCGLRSESSSSRIVGGSPSPARKWPWIVSLQNSSRDISHFCGGTLVDNEWIVTAAHCLHDSMITENADLNDITAVLGITNRDSYYVYKQSSTIETFYIHPDYNPLTFENDIALLKLSSSVSYTEYVRPACIATPDMNVDPGTLCAIAGWGLTEEAGTEVPTRLQEAVVPLVAFEECSRLIDVLPGTTQVQNGMQCAGYLDGGVDTCQGDSGGPLMYQGAEDGRWYLYGVTSFGIGCANQNMPGIYTKVNLYNDFLERFRP